MAVNIEEGGSGIEYHTQHRSDQSTQRGGSSIDNVEGMTPIPRFIYSKLGNFTNQRTITLEKMEPQENEYEFFMMEMERLNDILRLGEIVPADLYNIVELDAYLGELGMQTFYPFEDDVYNVPSWIDITIPSEYRNVVAKPFSIDKNVITSISGEDYNIIHRT